MLSLMKFVLFSSLLSSLLGPFSSPLQSHLRKQICLNKSCNSRRLIELFNGDKSVSGDAPTLTLRPDSDRQSFFHGNRAVSIRAIYAASAVWPLLGRRTSTLKLAGFVFREKITRSSWLIPRKISRLVYDSTRFPPHNCTMKSGLGTVKALSNWERAQTFHNDHQI